MKQETSSKFEKDSLESDDEEEEFKIDHVKN